MFHRPQLLKPQANKRVWSAMKVSLLSGFHVQSHDGSMRDPMASRTHHDLPKPFLIHKLFGLINSKQSIGGNKNSSFAYSCSNQVGFGRVLFYFPECKK